MLCAISIVFERTIYNQNKKTDERKIWQRNMVFGKSFQE